MMDRAQSKDCGKSLNCFCWLFVVTVVVIVVVLQSSSLFLSLTSTHSATFIAQRLRSISSLLNFFLPFFCVRIFYFQSPQPTHPHSFFFFNRPTRSLLNYLQFSNNPFSLLFSIIPPLSYISPSLSLIYRFQWTTHKQLLLFNILLTRLTST